MRWIQGAFEKIMTHKINLLYVVNLSIIVVDYI